MHDLRPVIHAIIDAVITTTPDFRVLTWNKGAEDLYGIASAEALGKPLDELLTIDGLRWTEHPGQQELSKQGKWRGCVRHGTRGGKAVTVSWSLSRVALPEATEEIFVAVATDLTERLQVEATLKASEQKTRSILRVAPIGIGLVVDRVLREVNDELCRMIGCSPEELLGKSARVLYPSDEEYEFVGKEKYRQIAEKGTGTVETHWRKRSGEVIDVLLSSTPINPDDPSEGVTFTALDVTERTRASAELREGEERYRDLFENANDEILLIDKWGKVLDVNGRNKDLFGMESSELIGKHVSSLARYTRFDVPAILRLLQQVFAADHPLRNLELECIRGDNGQQVVVELNVRLIRKNNAILGLMANVRDITDRRRAQQALSESEAKFRSIIESSPMGMHLYSLESDGRLVFQGANPAADRILGVANQQFVGRTIEEAFPALTKTEVPRRYRDVAAKGGLWTTSQIDYKDDRVAGAFEVYAFQTSPNRMAAMFLDITARLQAEEALREKTEEVDRFFSSALDLLCIADTDGRFRRLNPEWEKTLGYRLDEMLGKPFLDFVHPDDLEATREKIADLVGQSPVANFTNRYRHKDGSYRWIEWRWFPAGKIIYAAARDVTERKKSEQALLESERLNRMIAEMASDYIFHLALDPSGRPAMDYASKSFYEITGRSLGQVASLDKWSDFLHADDLPRIMDAFRRLIAEKQPVEAECRAYAKGTMRWNRIYARPELDPTG